MTRQSALTKILAVAGALLTWLPILAPGLLAAASILTGGRLRFDFLMPAELFPVVLAGCGLLLWAALRLRYGVRLIGWATGIAFSALIAGQILASVSGLATGRTAPGGLWWVLVLASIGVYTLAAAAAGVGGGLLVHHLFRRQA